MTQSREWIADLETVRVTIGDTPRVVVIMLHGYAMQPDELVPFARSLGVPATYYFPEAPLDAEPSGKAWWPIDQERRANALAAGPRDLFAEHPPGAAAAREALRRYVAAVESQQPEIPLALVGFSQGGMLACDALLRRAVSAAGLALLSSSRISADEWEPLAPRLHGVPILVSHGEQDPDLAFGAGLALREFCAKAGAFVTWVPFTGAHEVPLIVWREIRRFLTGLNPQRAATQGFRR